MADPFKVSWKRTVTIQLTPNDEGPEGINCAICHASTPEWCYTYRINGAHITAGMCIRCIDALEKDLSK